MGKRVDRWEVRVRFLIFWSFYVIGGGNSSFRGRTFNLIGWVSGVRF